MVEHQTFQRIVIRAFLWKLCQFVSGEVCKKRKKKLETYNLLFFNSTGLEKNVVLQELRTGGNDIKSETNFSANRNVLSRFYTIT